MFWKSLESVMVGLGVIAELLVFKRRVGGKNGDVDVAETGALPNSWVFGDARGPPLGLEYGTALYLRPRLARQIKQSATARKKRIAPPTEEAMMIYIIVGGNVFCFSVEEPWVLEPLAMLFDVVLVMSGDDEMTLSVSVGVGVISGADNVGVAVGTSISENVTGDG